ncbi:MAG: RdgB/HAM1 family non-canonical purine NTP pyrophosphatase [Spirochaetes bacterium]|nr:RdgB/HAM1 family non-canonical purine NTP pyrophosphatase [Spirochaetota bacterium]
MLTNVIFASSNDHKTQELKQIFKGYLTLDNLKSKGFNQEIIEDGSSFIENSLIKCRTVFEKYQQPVLADDSGLCVTALKGRPGIHSARYGGAGLTDQQRYEQLLEELKKVKNKDYSASFVCALVLYFNPNRFYIIQEEVCGEIIFQPKGEQGFGYDPVFYLKQFAKTAAQLTAEEKNRISHRGKAAQKMLQLIKDL